MFTANTAYCSADERTLNSCGSNVQSTEAFWVLVGIHHLRTAPSHIGAYSVLSFSLFCRSMMIDRCLNCAPIRTRVTVHHQPSQPEKKTSRKATIRVCFKEGIVEVFVCLFGLEVGSYFKVWPKQAPASSARFVGLLGIRSAGVYTGISVPGSKRVESNAENGINHSQTHWRS